MSCPTTRTRSPVTSKQHIEAHCHSQQQTKEKENRQREINARFTFNSIVLSSSRPLFFLFPFIYWEFPDFFPSWICVVSVILLFSNMPASSEYERDREREYVQERERDRDRNNDRDDDRNRKRSRDADINVGSRGKDSRSDRYRQSDRDKDRDRDRDKHKVRQKYRHRDIEREREYREQDKARDRYRHQDKDRDTKRDQRYRDTDRDIGRRIRDADTEKDSASVRRTDDHDKHDGNHHHHHHHHRSSHDHHRSSEQQKRSGRDVKAKDNSKLVAASALYLLQKDKDTNAGFDKAGMDDLGHRHYKASDANEYLWENDIQTKFVWKKKNEKLKKMGVDIQELTEESEAQRREKVKNELMKAKQRRLQREAEREAFEKEQDRLAREREQELNADWERKEEQMHAENYYAKQAIRLREHRPTLIDTLAQNLRLDLDDLDAELDDPHETLLSIAQLITSVTDPKLIVNKLKEVIEGTDTELDYLYFYQDMLSKKTTLLVNKASHSGDAGGIGMRENDAQEYGDDDHELRVKQHIMVKVDERMRQDYWEGIATIAMDLARQLFAKHPEIMATIEQESSLVAGISRQTLAGVHDSVVDDIENLLKSKDAHEMEEMKKTISEQLKLGQIPDVDYWNALLHRLEIHIAQRKVKEIHRYLLELKLKQMEQRKVEEDENSVKMDQKQTRDEASGLDLILQHQLLNQSAAEAGDAEENYEDEIKLDEQVYHWQDKYRPRKPKYFNRCHTGYEWNKYNRTHYDHDNPPPKTVRGYKFNIIYADLIDSSKAPTYSVLKTENPDVAILRFHAGPPYEDIAFKIVNREWEYSHKRGFKCTFERGVLHLWFLFKRMRYRR